MQYGVMLLDKASKICGSDEKLAKRLGTSRPNISLMRAGKRAISPVTAAELADIANEDVTYAVNMAMLESVRGTPKENRIRDILGKALAAGAVAMLATGSNAGQSGFINSAAKSTYDVTKILSAVGRVQHAQLQIAGQRLRSLPLPFDSDADFALELEFAGGLLCRLKGQGLELRAMPTQCAVGSYQC